MDNTCYCNQDLCNGSGGDSGNGNGGGHGGYGNGILPTTNGPSVGGLQCFGNSGKVTCGSGENLCVYQKTKTGNIVIITPNGCGTAGGGMQAVSTRSV